MLTRGGGYIRDDGTHELLQSGDGYGVCACVEVESLLEIGFIPVSLGEREGGEVVDECTGEEEEEEGGEVVREAVHGGRERQQKQDGEGGEQDIRHQQRRAVGTGLPCSSDDEEPDLPEEDDGEGGEEEELHEPGPAREFG
ncbi:hypothetical protein V490_07709 [Pseudogymnoascus sp. VKM F-3557]|nr:hypothetical protein V490_07709 [Pseudogymnoascus sp. VKM F-3557]